MIIRHFFHKFKQSHIVSEYVAGNAESIKHSNLSLDIRHPVGGRKYVFIGDDSYVNASCVFETEGGEFKVGNKSYVGGGDSNLPILSSYR